MIAHATFKEIEDKRQEVIKKRGIAQSIASNPELYRELPSPIKKGTVRLLGADNRKWFCPWCGGELKLERVIDGTGSFLAGTKPLYFYGCDKCDYQYGSWGLT